MNVSTTSSEAGAGDVPVLEAAAPLSKVAATHGWTSVHTLAQEFYQSAQGSDVLRKEKFRDHFAYFEAEHGPVVDFYFSDRIAAACIYTRGHRPGQDELFLTFPAQSLAPTWVCELLYEGYGLHAEICEVLAIADRRTCMNILFMLIAQILHIMESYHPRPSARMGARQGASQLGGHDNGAPTEEAHSEIGAIPSSSGPIANGALKRLPIQVLYRQQLSEARRFYERSAQRAAQTTYFVGMLVGFVFLTLLDFVLLKVVAPTVVAPNFEPDIRMLSACFITGAIGAVVSVMQRMTAGSLSLKYRAGRTIVALLGAFRPIIGSVFATVTYLLLLTSLVPLAIPDSEHNPLRPTYFFILVAFFAGFSERWVQDMLATGQRQLSVGRGTTVPE